MWTMRVYQQPVQEVGGADGNCEETVVSDNDVIQPQEGELVRFCLSPTESCVVCSSSRM